MKNNLNVNKGNRCQRDWIEVANKKWWDGRKKKKEENYRKE